LNTKQKAASDSPNRSSGKKRRPSRVNAGSSIRRSPTPRLDCDPSLTGHAPFSWTSQETRGSPTASGRRWAPRGADRRRRRDPGRWRLVPNGRWNARDDRGLFRPGAGPPSTSAVGSGQAARAPRRVLGTLHEGGEAMALKSTPIAPRAQPRDWSGKRVSRSTTPSHQSSGLTVQ
jgi:hypothetical protein